MTQLIKEQRYAIFVMYKQGFSHKLIQADSTSKCNGFFAKFGKKIDL